MTQSSPTPFDVLLAHLAPLGRSALLPALHAAQARQGYISEPVAQIIAKTLGVPLADVHGVIEFYNLFYTHPTGKRTLRVCTDPACALQGAEEILQAICHHLEIPPGGQTPDGEWMIERTTCLGFCHRAPAASLTNWDGGEGEVGKENLAPSSQTFTLPAVSPQQLIQSLERGNPPLQPDFIGGEPRLLTALCGGSRSATLEEYESLGGMQALRHWVGARRNPGELIAEIKASGLVGMGGAAFPTGLKWQGAAEASGSPKYFVINADESEPGTFKDRILLEGDPWRVLEGAVLGAYAISAHRIYAFVRGEYPLAIERLQSACADLYRAGYLGENILDSGYTVDVEIRVGAGAYICGEETALFAAIQGERGYPRIKPPFPTTYGLFGKPTVINNVETLAKVPYILAHGAAVYRQIGTERSPGTKLFCLSGDIIHPGLYEVPFGTPLSHLIEDLAGGVRGGKLQAVLLGGAAGAFVPLELLDVRLSFEDLRAVGLPLGSGVVMVFNETRDMRQVLVQLARFFAHESCGKCYPCQLGTQRQLEVLERFALGKAVRGDKDRLLDIGWTMSDASLCGLGQTAASAVLSAARLWSQWFEEGKS